MVDNKIFESDAAFEAALANAEKAQQPVTEESEEVGEETDAQDGERAAEEELPAEEEEKEEADEEDASESSEEEADVEDKSIMVPKSRLDKKEQLRKEAEERAQTERDQRIRVETELANFKKALELYTNRNTDTKDDQAETDDLKDILDTEGYGRVSKRVEAVEKKLAEKEKKDAEDAAFNASMGAFKASVAEQANAYAKTHPDYPEAFQKICEVEMEKARVFAADETEAKAIASSAVIAIAAKAYTDNKSIPETFYNLAKKQGFTGKKANGSGPNLDAIGENMKKSKSVGSTPSAAAKLSATDYTRHENFARLKGKHGKIDGDKFEALLKQVERGQI